MYPIKLDIGHCAKLIYIPTDRFKSEYLSVSFLLPLKEKDSQQNAMLMALARRGTVSYPTLAALNQHLDEMYSTSISSFNRRLGDRQLLGFSADFLAARYVGGGNGLLPQVIDILAELLFEPTTDEAGMLRADYIAGEKQNLIDAIRSKINNPRGYAMSHCRQMLCEGEPHGLPLIGTEEEANALDAAGLTARHRAFCREIFPIFTYVGNQPSADVAALLTARFGSLIGSSTSYCAAVHVGDHSLKEKEEEMSLLQGKLSLGFRTDVDLTHTLAPAMLYFNEIYGGSPASKLFLNVREKKSLCYHCSSSLDLYKGVLFANCGMKVENHAIAKEAMLTEFDAIARGRISHVEFEAARRSIEHSYRQSYDSPALLSRFYSGRAAAGVDEDMNTWCDRLASVKKEDVIEAAAHIMHKASFFLKGTKSGEGEDEE